MIIIMTVGNNKKLSIFVLAGIVALSSVAATIMLDETNNATLVTMPIVTESDNQNQEIHGEPKNVSKPSEYKYWTGVPLLQAMPASMDRENYHNVSPTEFDWLKRSIDNGIAIVDKDDLREFEKISNGNYYFKVGENMYTIHYSTAKVNLEEHYIRAIPQDNDKPSSKISESDLISKSLEDPYRWIKINEDEVSQYLTLTENGKLFNTSQGDIELQYIGKNSPESSLQQYETIVDRSAGKLGEENDQ